MLRGMFLNLYLEHFIKVKKIVLKVEAFLDVFSLNSMIYIFLFQSAITKDFKSRVLFLLF